MTLKNLLGDDAFWQVNKAISRKTSIHAAVLLADLVSKREYFKKEGFKMNGGWFFNTVENIQKDTTLSKFQQSSAIKELEKIGFINVEYKGNPRKRFYRVNDAVVVKFLVEHKGVDGKRSRNLTTSSQETLPLEGEKLDGYNNKNKCSKNKQKENKRKKESGQHNVSFFSVEQAHAMLEQGGIIPKNMVTEQTYNVLLETYCCDNEGNIKQMAF